MLFLIAALREETQDLFDDILPVVYCGVGKVNAALHTVRLLQRYQPRSIVNFGTAGSRVFAPHTWLIATSLFSATCTSKHWVSI